MLKFAKLALAAAVASGAMSAATAAPFFIDTGVDAAIDANGSTKTAIIDELGYTGTLATSIYLGNPTVAGTSVIDTNNMALAAGFGFSTGNKTAVAGNTINFKNPADPTNLNINALNSPPDVNGFGSGEPPVPYGFGGTAGAGNGVWGLTYTYELYGTTVDVDGNGTSDQVKYTSGYFDVYYQDAAGAFAANASANDGRKVLRLLVTGSEFQGVNLSITGKLDYSAASGITLDPFVKNLFNTANGKTFFDAAENASWIIDTNVNPPIPTPDQLWASPNGPLFRQATLDGSITFAAPEPGSLALLGFALAGAGFVTSRRRKA